MNKDINRRRLKVSPPAQNVSLYPYKHRPRGKLPAGTVAVMTAGSYLLDDIVLKPLARYLDKPQLVQGKNLYFRPVIRRLDRKSVV